MASKYVYLLCYRADARFQHSYAVSNVYTSESRCESVLRHLVETDPAIYDGHLVMIKMELDENE